MVVQFPCLGQFLHVPSCLVLLAPLIGLCQVSTIGLGGGGGGGGGGRGWEGGGGHVCTTCVHIHMVHKGICVRD